MKLKSLAGIGILALLTGCLAGCTGTAKTEQKVSAPTDYDGLMSYFKEEAAEKEVSCWYTGEEDKTWLEGAAGDFEKAYGVKVNLVYYDGVSLFDDLNQANQKGTGPEVYLTSNDQIELAVQSGMAEENSWFTDEYWKNNYPETAKRAITYKNKQYGYPVYFDTYCLVYDANLLENAPASIEDILSFADAYEDTGSTKAIFRWDVADPYINTMFLASYADLFGENGDDSTAFSVNNEQCVASMEYFQSLSEYLWMDKSNISHDTIMNRIKEGTLVLGLCKTDILPVLYEIHAEKEETDYQIAYVPSLTSNLSSTTFSTTYSAFLNPYGKDMALGNLFALYLSMGQAKKQFSGNGKLPVIALKEEFDGWQSMIYAQYLNSKPVPKVMVLGDYLSESGIAFDAIWGGKDVKEQLNWLQTTMEEKIR